MFIWETLHAAGDDLNVREGRDSTPQYDNDICRPQRQRQRHLYTTNGTNIELFVSGVDVDDQLAARRAADVEFHRWNFILKLEGYRASLVTGVNSASYP